ncbi:MAG TPA: DUF2997 domain-containing protein [Anaeromyxobacteraceae bacterium]|nr:DUF2997 domain-containing protein [Anaeromyxobacteraceae bacterium]
MAEKLEIEVTIAPDGTVKLETHGLKGQGCLAETEAVEKALGTVRSRTRTAEWYQQATAAKGRTTQR